jgi:soluble lytic murein transglycosylase
LGKLHLARGETEAARTTLSEAIAGAPDEYYGLRAAQIAPTDQGAPSPPPNRPSRSGMADREAAELWLADWLGLESSEGLGDLAPRLATDGRLQRGKELWKLGRFQQAKTELESLRSETYSNALDQYQLALSYRDLGLYRSSVLCAWRLIGLSPVTRTLDAPGFVLRLAYPTYYENLVLENARRTDLDPQLIFSLIRQESLFESLATSSASAHGLMQVIPPTGAEIAADLDWPPDYETPDLYRPYVSLRFGTHYLAKQRDRFDGRIDVALAAYNGGPFNAQRWLERAGNDRDLFLEQITFSETRLYVRRIQEHLAVYRALEEDNTASGSWPTDS